MMCRHGLQACWLSRSVVLLALYPARISVSSSLLTATMNQKSSLREDLQFVSWVLTGNTLPAPAPSLGLLFCGGPGGLGPRSFAFQREALAGQLALGFLRPGKNPGAYTSATHWRLPYSPKRPVPLGVPAGWLAGLGGSRLSPEAMRSR